MLEDSVVVVHCWLNVESTEIEAMPTVALTLACGAGGEGGGAGRVGGGTFQMRATL